MFSLTSAIENNYTDPASCFVFGHGVEEEQLEGKSTEFTILARDKFHVFRKTGGDTFR